MYIIKEISQTPMEIFENEPVEDEIMIFPTLRRTHGLTCMFCHMKWGDIIYNGTDISRICSHCKEKILDEVLTRKVNLYNFSNLFEKMSRVHEEIIEIGMHPCRVRQTQLIDTLHLFRKYSGDS